MTRDRSRALLLALVGRMPGLAEEVEALLSAVQPWAAAADSAADGSATGIRAALAPPAGADAEWVKFTKKWRYGVEQREAIRTVLSGILDASKA
mmetsp:Transcript_68984/g.206881  ORF Transcript_68984/g.206881 Transcript_68984/m.206881 type:complete len:94 (+) Transcript_68984:3-284(+)